MKRYILFASLLSLLVISVAYASTVVDHTVDGRTVRMETSSFRDFYGDRAESRSYVRWFSSVDSLDASTATFNNDPANQTGGWELKDSGYAYCYSNNSNCSSSGWTSPAPYMGGYYEGAGKYQCDLVECYATSSHSASRNGDWATDYTSNTGSHSSSQCMTTPGC